MPSAAANKHSNPTFKPNLASILLVPLFNSIQDLLGSDVMSNFPPMPANSTSPN